MSKKKEGLKYKLEIIYSPEDDGYVVKVPELPGCVTHGDSIEKALKMSYEAIDAYLESLKARKLPIPIPLADKKYSGNIPLRIDPLLHRDIVVQAEVEGVSVNKLIESKLKKAI